MDRPSQRRAGDDGGACRRRESQGRSPRRWKEAWSAKVEEIFDGRMLVKHRHVELLIWSAAAYQNEYKAIEAMAPQDLPAIVGVTIAVERARPLQALLRANNVPFALAEGDRVLSGPRPVGRPDVRVPAAELAGARTSRSAHASLERALRAIMTSRTRDHPPRLRPPRQHHRASATVGDAAPLFDARLPVVARSSSPRRGRAPHDVTAAGRPTRCALMRSAPARGRPAATAQDTSASRSRKGPSMDDGSAWSIASATAAGTIWRALPGAARQHHLADTQKVGRAQAQA